MARFWVGGGSSTNFGAIGNTNWAATSGGANNQSVPGSGDDATFDGAASGNGACIIAASVTVLSLTFTSGYTNTITIGDGGSRSLTIGGNFTDVTNHSWAINTVAANALIIPAASTIASGGKTFPGNVSFTGNNTKALNGNWTISGTLTCSTSTTTINKTTAEVLSCAGWTVTGTTTGTINITITGGTWSGGGTNTVSAVNIAGNVTVSGSINYSTGTLTYTSGTVTTTSSTLTIAASTTLNTNGISWNNIIFSAPSTIITINSLLTVNGTLTINNINPITFAGTSGFTTATLSVIVTGTATVTLVNTVTYTITTAFNAFNSRTGSLLLFTSDHASNKAILTLNNGATCNVLASFTRIDASNGRAIWTFNGVVTTCFNIFSLTDLSFIKNKINATQAVGTY